MEGHCYRVTVEAVTDRTGKAVEGQSLRFTAACHDDLFAVTSRLYAHTPFDRDTAAALAVGLKLLAEVALENRNNPMFAGIRPALGEFMRDLKRMPGGELA
jgi:hypothetical protein